MTRRTADDEMTWAKVVAIFAGTFAAVFGAVVVGGSWVLQRLVWTRR